MSTDFNTLTLIPAIMLLLLVVRGLSPFVAKATSVELRYFSLGFCLIVGAVILRGLYWDAAQHILRGTEQWQAWSALMSGKVVINGVLNLGLIGGALCILRALHEMIPEKERGRWSLLTAPFYPRGWCFTRLVVQFRQHKRRK